MILLDPLGRRIDYLRMSVTGRCNLRCIYCLPRDSRCCAPGALPLDSRLIFSVAQAAMHYGLQKVRLTGGEPLLRDDIIDIVRTLKQMGVPDLSMTTNGVLLAGVAPALKAAGLDRINVSLDSLDPDAYSRITGGGSLPPVMEAIDAAADAGLLPVKINVVPLRGVNDSEAAGFAALTIDRPVHVRFIELMPAGHKNPGIESLAVPSVETMEKVATAFRSQGRRLLFEGEGGSSRNYRLEGAKGIIGFISPVSNHFCGRCNRMRLTSSGKLRPCLFSADELEIIPGASPDEIENILKQAVLRKPAGRKTGSAIPGRMSSIGG
ncbi:MAG: GTP 3',8-cyclase MoaA [Actinomycetota bacterium]|nr:GTP 3',8-cyclase MoaA [Actinomycetota bacterium]